MGVRDFVYIYIQGCIWCFFGAFYLKMQYITNKQFRYLILLSAIVLDNGNGVDIQCGLRNRRNT